MPLLAKQISNQTKLSLKCTKNNIQCHFDKHDFFIKKAIKKYQYPCLNPCTYVQVNAQKFCFSFLNYIILVLPFLQSVARCGAACTERNAQYKFLINILLILELQNWTFRTGLSEMDFHNQSFETGLLKRFFQKQSFRTRLKIRQSTI